MVDGAIKGYPKKDSRVLSFFGWRMAYSYRDHRRGYVFEALTVLIDQLHRMAPDRAFGFACKNLILISWLPGGVRDGNRGFFCTGELLNGYDILVGKFP